MPNSRKIILKLKEIKQERNLTINDILSMIHANGDYLSQTSVSRVFRKGSEDKSFNYKATLVPIQKALLGKNTTIEKKETTIPALSERERLLLEYYSKMSPEMQNSMVAIFESVAMRQQDKP